MVEHGGVWWSMVEHGGNIIANRAKAGTGGSGSAQGIPVSHSANTGGGKTQEEEEEVPTQAPP